MSLQTPLLSQDHSEKDTHSFPEPVGEQNANWFSKLFFVWTTRYVRDANARRAVKEQLEDEDIFPMHPEMDTEDVASRFHRIWEDYAQCVRNRRSVSAAVKPVDNADANLVHGGEFTHKEAQWITSRTFLKLSESTLLRAFGFQLLATFANLAIPFLVERLLAFVEGETTWSVSTGYMLACLMGITIFIQSVCAAQTWQHSERTWLVWRSATMTSVYRKSLKISESSKQESSTGEITNIMAQDASRIGTFAIQLPIGIGAMIEIAGFLVILFIMLGPSMLVGFGVLLVSFPVTERLASWYDNTFDTVSTTRDNRIKKTNEALQGILSVKMNAWEEKVKASIQEIRNKELGMIRYLVYIVVTLRCTIEMVPVVATTATITTYALSKTDVSVPVLFASMNVFVTIKEALFMAPVFISDYAEFNVGIARVSKFLAMGEIESTKGESHVDQTSASMPSESKPSPRSLEQVAVEDAEVEIFDGQFTWSSVKKASKEDEEGSDDTTDDASIVLEVDEQTAEKNTIPVLDNVNCRIQTGKLTAVIGPVGTGKSSLCQAIIGELPLTRGAIHSREQSFAYAAQSAWILNTTVKENILFGQPYDEKRYREVIRVCQLIPDLKLLPMGDGTMIGEKGITLSGGQKQRVNIARAAYSSHDLVILDDPLSALDPAVANLVFTECICKFMQGKTRVVVTNQLNFLKSCDWVMLLALKDRETSSSAEVKLQLASSEAKANTETNNNTNTETDDNNNTKTDNNKNKTNTGHIVQQGTFDDLMSHKSQILNELLESFNKHSKCDDDDEGEDVEVEEATQMLLSDLTDEELAKIFRDDESAKDSLMQQEEREVGSVALSVYQQYIGYGGGARVFLGGSFLMAIAQLLTILNISWVSFWSEAIKNNYTDHLVPFDQIEDMFDVDLHFPRDNEHQGALVYAIGYALTAVMASLSIAFSTMLFLFMGLRATKNLHNALLDSVVQAPMSFFDSTPVGRVLSRFSGDLDKIRYAASQFASCVRGIFGVLAALITIGVIIPQFFLVTLVTIPIYYILQKIYRPIARDTTRMSSISLSPVYAQFTETLMGLSTIRAFNDNERFQKMNVKGVERFIKNQYATATLQNWLTMQVGMLNALLLLFAAVLAIYASTSSVLSAGACGIIITFVMKISGQMTNLMLLLTFFELSMNASERVIHYTNNLEQEKEHHSKNPPRESWPESGSIQLNNLRMRYRKDKPLVLKGLNVTIQGGEKVGIVGRTGSGKSSLMMALLRIVEPVENEDPTAAPPIMIDGVDVTKIGLTELRSEINIVPQNPVIFSGTIRENIDPWKQHSDAEMWACLEKCNLKEFVARSKDKLDMELAEYGDNLSQGQKQLLCIARALLNHAKIILLDEATSSIDFETDAIVQKTIRESDFSGCTILTIAHRINTVIDNDKILVIDQGCVAEFGSPKELLENPEGHLTKILSEHNRKDE